VAGLDLPGPGVLPAHWLEKCIDAGIVRSTSSDTLLSGVQPASIDLHLGEVAHRLRCSFLPGRATVEERLAEFGMGEIDLTSGGAVLERECPYLIPLQEELDLPAMLRAKANPKSSTGRIDVFTRLITDRGQRFDEVAAGYRGRLYLEVVSSTFTVKVHPGLALNQLRLMKGSALVSDAELLEIHRDEPILFHNGSAVPPEELDQSFGVFMGLDFAKERGRPVGYRAKRNSRLLDLDRIGEHDPEDYWEEVRVEDGHQVVLEPGAFYLLLSSEGIKIPPNLAGEMVAYDPTSGELRTHYAGFFDPGFGWDHWGLVGSRAALEVRAHDVPFVVQDRQPVCKIAFERLVEPTAVLYGDSIGSNYQGQQNTLSKYFKRPDPERQLALIELAGQPSPTKRAKRR
jgi:dCTP deaminase